MTSALQTVLEIAGVGSTLLFLALIGLIGLMYALTSPWLYRRLAPSSAGQPLAEAGASAGTEEEAAAAGAGARPEEEVAATNARVEAEAEQDRRRRAVALAVAVACTRVERPARRGIPSAPEAPSEWRRVHRMRRLAKPRTRARARA